MRYISYAGLLHPAGVINHYQPIVNLKTGAVLAVETLGRLQAATELVYPGSFLPSFSVSEIERLFFISVAQGMPDLAVFRRHFDSLRITFNLDPRVLTRAGFLGRLASAVPGSLRSGVTLELLESDDFEGADVAFAVVTELVSLGFKVALDDVGSGYSSLDRLRCLPIATIKLDMAFARNLSNEPGGLHFIQAMISLARGLRRQLVVEGVETEEIAAALAVLGVECAQGYGLGLPMSAPDLEMWLSHPKPPINREPNGLLSAYAAHLSIVEACRSMMGQPLPVAWSNAANDPHACSIGKYFDRDGLHDTALGRAHKHFHTVLTRYDQDPETWEAATDSLWREFQTAICRKANGKVQN